MCSSCLAEYAEDHGPAARPERADEALAAIVALYDTPDCSTGGPLHVEIDDMNIDHSWDPWNGTDRNGQPYYGPEALAAAQAVSDLLKPMTVPERAWVVAAFWTHS